MRASRTVSTGSWGKPSSASPRPNDGPVSRLTRCAPGTSDGTRRRHRQKRHSRQRAWQRRDTSLLISAGRREQTRGRRYCGGWMAFATATARGSGTPVARSQLLQSPRRCKILYQQLHGLSPDGGGNCNSGAFFSTFKRTHVASFSDSEPCRWSACTCSGPMQTAAAQKRPGDLALLATKNCRARFAAVRLVCCWSAWPRSGRCLRIRDRARRRRAATRRASRRLGRP
mmetsp:Transcript_12492/g.41680  ORF Transcript_12492/g.41680 Transcript_12492/m.41680 type:complete len:228 (+) Transcript_12492:620-1303(+)